MLFNILWFVIGFITGFLFLIFCCIIYGIRHTEKEESIEFQRKKLLSLYDDLTIKEKESYNKYLEKELLLKMDREKKIKTVEAETLEKLRNLNC